MKLCNAPGCESPLTAKQDDGTGKHKVCPPKPDRERHLAERKRRFPTLDEWHEKLKQGREPWKEDG